MSSARDAPSPPRLVVTIDGPAGTGKSTVAHRLADLLNLAYLDTGAMYRGAAVLALEQDIDPADGLALAAAVARVTMAFDWDIDPPRLLLDGRDISQRIREMDVSSIVSIVAAQAPVRDVLVQQQRGVADMHGRLVTEGRDQGSVVFPDAPVRFYLDAEPGERAQRRLRQLHDAGRDVDKAVVIKDITDRDRIDSTREASPLTRPEGCIDIDTTNLTIDQVVELLRAKVEEVFGRMSDNAGATSGGGDDV